MLDKHYEQHYRHMKRELAMVQLRRGDGLQVLEEAAAIARRWRRLLPLPGITVTQVDYFSACLPPFEAELEYYLLLVEAEKKGARHSLQGWKDFWLGEACRLETRIEQHPALYDYYLHPTADQDDRFFGGDTALAVLHSRQLAGFMALERYNRYLETLFALYFNTHRS
jgi:hypothetical protein